MIPKKCISIDAEQIQAAISGCRFSSAASWQKYSTMGAGTASFMLFELSTLSQLTA